ncbi:MAG: tRNA (adenosine(37)-N6)-threonylcarbamoyltransferase complex dimerization subunit type 1 TsaB [Planctomycetaceae bacterium]
MKFTQHPTHHTAVSLGQELITMWIVGIETSCREGSVALLDDDKLVVERSLSHAGRQHARTLVHELQQMLAESGVAPRLCDVIAVSRGPGSFTGLRVGVACAKTWGFATGCAVIGVDTFEAVAQRAPSDLCEIDVIADAQRGDLYLGRYRRRVDTVWERQGEVGIVPADDWLYELRTDRTVTGPAVENLRSRLTANIGRLPEELRFPTASGVARIGKRTAETGSIANLWSLEPLYLRRSSAEEKADLSRPL